MGTILPIIFSFIFINIFAFGARSLLRYTNKKIWDIKTLDQIGKYLPFVGWLFFLMFGAGIGLEWKFILPVGATGLSIILIFCLILIITLPLSLLIRTTIIFLKSRKAHKPKIEFNQQRRLLIKSAAAAVPVLTLGATTNGFASAFQKVKLPEIEFDYSNLPNALDGFRILHLSDLHLGYYYQLDDLEQLLLSVESQSFDAILITGDVADDLNLLTDALKMIDQVKTKLPKFVSLGNHEYFRGIKEVKQQIDKSPIPLLLNNHQVIKLEDTNLVIAGADDPIIMRSDITGFLDKTVGQSLQNAPEDAFRILLSHRPKALDVWDTYKIDLILAGHTHGGQIGLTLSLGKI